MNVRLYHVSTNLFILANGAVQVDTLRPGVVWGRVAAELSRVSIHRVTRCQRHLSNLDRTLLESIGVKVLRRFVILGINGAIGESSLIVRFLVAQVSAHSRANLLGVETLAFSLGQVCLHVDVFRRQARRSGIRLSCIDSGESVNAVPARQILFNGLHVHRTVHLSSELVLRSKSVLVKVG